MGTRNKLRPSIRIRSSQLPGVPFFLVVHWPPVHEDKGGRSNDRELCMVSEHDRKSLLGYCFSELAQRDSRVRGDLKDGDSGCGIP